MSVHIILDVNPEPWTSPEVSVGRKGGRVFPRVYKSSALNAYQAAVKEALEGAMESPTEDDVMLRFYLWRQLPMYETERQRKVRKHEADATNLQKALEDALQGVLFKNDRQVQDARTVVMEQGHGTRPMIVVVMQPWRGAPELPEFLTERIAAHIKSFDKVIEPERREFNVKEIF